LGRPIAIPEGSLVSHPPMEPTPHMGTLNPFLAFAFTTHTNGSLSDWI